MIAEASLINSAEGLIPSLLIDGAAKIQSKDLGAAPSMSRDGSGNSLSDFNWPCSAKSLQGPFASIGESGSRFDNCLRGEYQKSVP